ncbi:MAG: LD-carboxypeptidase [Proteobacteria bacterium]|nr:LD-carboxypeptidase [Pseudomonadota bacterium]
MLKPEALKQGDRIDVIAPGRSGPKAEIAAIERVITGQGFTARIPADIYGEDLLCSNRDEVRAQHLVQALTATDSKAVWCARGGYGAARIVEILRVNKKPKTPKWFIGFSDNTVLHMFLNQEWGWSTLHAPVLFQIAEEKVDEVSVAMTVDVLKGELKALHHPLTAINAHAHRKHTITAPIVGGNQTLVQCSAGTSWQLDTQKKIVLLEDCDEESYRVDRALLQLSQSGILEGVEAIVFGAFTHPKPEYEAAVMAVLKRFATAQAIPVFHTENVGHRSMNHPVVLGAPATITAGVDPVLSITL